MAIEYDRLIAYFDGDISNLERSAAKADQIIDKIESRFRNLLTEIKLNISVDNAATQKVEAEIKRLKSLTVKTDSSAAAGKSIVDGLTGGINKNAADPVSAISKIASKIISTAKTILGIKSPSIVFAQIGRFIVQGLGSGMNSAFSSTFFANFAANISASFMSVLGQIPGQVQEILNKAVTIASERSNALKGLESAANFKGIDASAAQESVQNLRLVKAGILDLSDAATGYKSLISAGFSDEQAVNVLESFSDAAAFGKQSALSFGEAISRAAEGVKNQNSALVDNVGLTKNLSVILKERGFELQDLSDKTKGQNAINALYNGILEETKGQVGDADKLTQGYTGSTAALENAQKNLYAAIGNLIIQSPQMIEANKVLTEQINSYKEGVTDANSETGKFAQESIETYAKLKGSSISLATTIKYELAVLLDAMAIAGAGMGITITAIVEGFLFPFRVGIDEIYKTFTALSNFVSTGTFELPPPTDFSEYFKYTNQISKDISDLSSSLSKNYDSMNKSAKEFWKNWNRIGNAGNNSNNKHETIKLPPQADKTSQTKIEVESLKAIKTYRESFLKNQYQVERAILDSHLRFTAEDELKYAQQSAALEAKEIQSRISETKNYYGQMISASKGNAEAIQKLEIEKNKTINDLTTELQVNQIKSAKEIKQIEQRIYDERRQAAVEFANLSIREIKSYTDKQIYETERYLEKGLLETSSGYAKLKELTEQNTQEIIVQTRNAYEEQLKDLSLTAEKRTNLERQMYLEIQDIQEDSRRKQIEIDERRRNEFITRAENESQRLIGIYQQRAAAINEIGGILDVARLQPSALPQIKEQFYGELWKRVREAEQKMDTLKAEANAITANIIQKQTAGEDFNDLDQKRIAKIKEMATAYANWSKEYNRVPVIFENIVEAAGKIDDIRGFDKLAEDVLKAKQQLESAALDTKIGQLSEALAQLKNSGVSETSDAYKNMEAALNGAISEKQLQGFNQATEATSLYANSLEGLTAYLEKLKAGDKQTVLGVEEGVRKDILREQISGYQQLIVLKAQLENYDDVAAIEIERAALEEMLELRRAETQHIIEGNRSLQTRLQIMQAQLPSYSTALKDGFTSSIEGISNTFAQAATNWNTTGQTFFQSMAQGFKQMANQIIQELIRIAVMKLILNLAGSLFGGGFGGAISGAHGAGLSGINATTINLPGLAAGGTANAGQVHIVGERGPELFIPNQTGTVISNENTRKMLGTSNQGNTVVQNFNQTIHAPRGMVAPKSRRQIADETRAAASRGAKYG